MTLTDMGAAPPHIDITFMLYAIHASIHHAPTPFLKKTGLTPLYYNTEQITGDIIARASIRGCFGVLLVPPPPLNLAGCAYAV